MCRIAVRWYWVMQRGLLWTTYMYLVLKVELNIPQLYLFQLKVNLIYFLFCINTKSYLYL